MRAIHSDTKLAVLVNGMKSEWFQITTGSSRQGARYHLEQFPIHGKNNGSSEGNAQLTMQSMCMAQE